MERTYESAAALVGRAGVRRDKQDEKSRVNQDEKQPVRQRKEGVARLELPDWLKCFRSAIPVVVAGLVASLFLTS